MRARPQRSRPLAPAAAGLAAAALAALPPLPAAACPTCAGGPGDDATAYVLMGFIALTAVPFSVLYGTAWRLRRRGSRSPPP